MRVSCLILFVLLLSGCSDSADSFSSNKNPTIHVDLNDLSPGMARAMGIPDPRFHALEDILEGIPIGDEVLITEKLPEGDRKYRQIGHSYVVHRGKELNGDFAVEWDGHRIEPHYPAVPGHELVVLVLVGDDGYEGFAILKKKVDP